jgi:hypothetical protein
MSEPREPEQHDVTCPHCSRAFTGPLLRGGTRRGFKCPHCRLFVPLARVETQERSGSAPAQP